MYQLPTCRRSHPLRRPPRHLFTGLFCIEKTLMLALVYARFGYVVDACTPPTEQRLLRDVAAAGRCRRRPRRGQQRRRPRL
jgi:hypothetical protein